MLHGKGTKQNFLTNSTHEDRCDALEDKTGYSADDLSTLGITGSDGGGRTDSSTYEIKQFPFPTDSSIREKQTIDIRKVRPELGEMSD